MNHLESLHLLSRLVALSRELVGEATTGEWLEQVLAWSLRQQDPDSASGNALGLSSGGLIDLNAGVQWGWGGGVIRGMGDPPQAGGRAAQAPPAGLWMFDPRSEHLHWSRSCFAMHELQHLSDISLPQAQAMVVHGHRNALLRAVQRAQHTLVPYDITLPRRTASGREILVRSIGLPCLSLGDGPPLLVGLLAQVPAAPGTAIAHAGADDELRQELWASNDAVLVCDAKGHVLFANRRMHGWCGDAQQCLVGQPLPTFQGALEPVLARIHAPTLHGRGRCAGRTRMAAPDGVPSSVWYDLRHCGGSLGSGGYWVLILKTLPPAEVGAAALAGTVKVAKPWLTGTRQQLLADIDEALVSKPLRQQMDAVLYMACSLGEGAEPTAAWPPALLEAVTQELCKWFVARGRVSIVGTGRYAVLLRDLAETEEEAVAVIEKLVARALASVQSQAAASGYPPLRTRTAALLIAGQAPGAESGMGAAFMKPRDLDARTVLTVVQMSARALGDEPVVLLRRRWAAIAEQARLRRRMGERLARGGVSAHLRAVHASSPEAPPMVVCVARLAQASLDQGLPPLDRLSSTQAGLPLLRRVDRHLMNAMRQAATSVAVHGLGPVCWVQLAAAHEDALAALVQLRQDLAQASDGQSSAGPRQWGVCLDSNALGGPQLLAAAQRCQALGLPVMLRHHWAAPIAPALWRILDSVWLDAAPTQAWANLTGGRTALQRWVLDARASGARVVAGNADLAQQASLNQALPYML